MAEHRARRLDRLRHRGKARHLGIPSLAMYRHIGEATMRLRSVMRLRVNGVNREAIGQSINKQCHAAKYAVETLQSLARSSSFIAQFNGICRNELTV